MLRRETVLQANGVFELPEVIVGNGAIQPQIGGARGILIVKINLGVKRQAVFDGQAQRGGLRSWTRFDLGIDLAVLVGVGAVQLGLENRLDEDHIGMEAGQRPHDVI